MKILFQTVILTIALFTLLTLNNAFALEGEGTATTFQKIDELLNQGENQQAWQRLQDLPDAGPQSKEKNWRMARAQYEMGRIAESDEEAERHYQEAEKLCRNVVKTNPDYSEGYKWLAITLGSRAKNANTKTQIKLSREVKENIEKAISLAPDDDISYLVLSRWHYKISALGFFSRTFAKIIYGGLPEASLAEAEILLWQAIEIHDRIAHRYNLAKIYKRMGRQKDVTTQLQLALLLPVTFPEETEELNKSRIKLQDNRE
ncbi:MAG: hypothetical protein QNK24_07235 [Desulfuromusa sp.]|nr:hypothetical protein [Desulfuromusa sp.]